MEGGGARGEFSRTVRDRGTSFCVSEGWCVLCLYKKKPNAENIPSVTIPTEIAIATFFAGFFGCVAVGFAIAPPELVTGGGFSVGGGGTTGYSLKNGMSGDDGMSGGGGGGVAGGGAETSGNNGWWRILLFSLGMRN